MPDERTTVEVEANDLERLAYFAAQGILQDAEGRDPMEGLTPEQEGDHRGQLGKWLAKAYAYRNMAADALGDELPYDETEILNAHNGR